MPANQDPDNEPETKEMTEEVEEEVEWISFLRFNHLFRGKQHHKEDEMLSALKSLRKCSCHFFARYFYGKPGVICICSTADIVTAFARQCHGIGKRAVISETIKYRDRHQAIKLDVETIR